MKTLDGLYVVQEKKKNKKQMQKKRLKTCLFKFVVVVTDDDRSLTVETCIFKSEKRCPFFTNYLYV